MLVPSKKLYYAVEAVFYIAYNAKSSPISGNEVAAAQNLPTRYLEPIMQKLVRAGILKGVRGPAGGYVLGRERRRITLADICDVIVDMKLPGSATPLGGKVLLPVGQELIARWREELSSVTMAGLCERASLAKVAATSDTSTDFTI